MKPTFEYGVCNKIFLGILIDKLNDSKLRDGELILCEVDSGHTSALRRRRLYQRITTA